MGPAADRGRFPRRRRLLSSTETNSKSARWTSGEVAGLSRQSGWVRIPHESLALGRPTVQDAALIRRKRRFDSFPSDDRGPGQSFGTRGDCVATKSTTHFACRAHDVVAACCFAKADVRVQFPLGAFGGESSGSTAQGGSLHRGARGISRAPGAALGKPTGRIRGPSRKRVRRTLRCGFESHGFRLSSSAAPRWATSSPPSMQRPTVCVAYGPIVQQEDTGKRWFESIRDHSGWQVGSCPPARRLTPA